MNGERALGALAFAHGAARQRRLMADDQLTGDVGQRVVAE
jgi:hypothetical protein